MLSVGVGVAINHAILVFQNYRPIAPHLVGGYV